MTVDLHPFTVQVDIYVARRKRMHSVMNDIGEQVFADPHLMNILTWLAEQELSQARFTDEEDTFLVTFTRETTSPPTDGDNDNG